MPLLAIVDGQRTVSTRVGSADWVTLQGDVRAKRRAVSMHPCGMPGSLRRSKLGLQFFAHKAGSSDCGAEHPGETPLHLAAKAEILVGCAEAGWDAEPEHRGEGWVADVLARNGIWQLAFEVQVSQQDASEYDRRQARYKASGVRAAWFVKHKGSVLPPNKDLPTLLLEEDGDGLYAHLGEHRVPLRQAVALLVGGKAPFRSHVSNGSLAETVVWVAESDECWKCHKRYWLWRVQGQTVTGNCGRQVSTDGSGAAIWSRIRPEADPEVVRAVRQAVSGEAIPTARMGLRYSKTVGGQYMAFSCPHCNAVCGDFFLGDFWRGVTEAQSERVLLLPGTVRGVRHPHYCLDVGRGTCNLPPAAVLAAEEAQDERREDREAEMPSGGLTTVGEMGVHQAISRMFGGF